MRRILYLVRHAEAVTARDGTDKLRALTQQGESDALQLATYIKEKNSNLNLILSSPATRALTTAHIIARYLSLDLKSIQVEDSIYSARKLEILKLLTNLADTIHQVMLVGHYPTIVELYNYLSGNESKKNMNPAEMCSLVFDVPWAEVTAGCGISNYSFHPSSH